MNTVYLTIGRLVVGVVVADVTIRTLDATRKRLAKVNLKKAWERGRRCLHGKPRFWK